MGLAASLGKAADAAIAIGGRNKLVSFIFPGAATLDHDTLTTTRAAGTTIARKCFVGPYRKSELPLDADFEIGDMKVLVTRNALGRDLTKGTRLGFDGSTWRIIDFNDVGPDETVLYIVQARK